MKKLILFLIVLFISSLAQATSITMPYCSESTGGFVYASHWNSNCNAISTYVNNQNIDGNTNISVGGVQTANIANLAVTDSKIAGITTAGKVNGSSITGMDNLPTGAGEVPIANITASNPGAAYLFLNGAQLLSPATGIYNYTTSASSSSTPTSTLKVAFGTIATNGGSGLATITNLPFTTSTSYVSICTSTSPTSGKACATSNVSASSTNLQDQTNGDTVTWYAIGT